MTCTSLQLTRFPNRKAFQEVRGTCISKQSDYVLVRSVEQVVNRPFPPQGKGRRTRDAYESRKDFLRSAAPAPHDHAAREMLRHQNRESPQRRRQPRLSSQRPSRQTQPQPNPDVMGPSPSSCWSLELASHVNINVFNVMLVRLSSPTSPGRRGQTTKTTFSGSQMCLCCSSASRKVSLQLWDSD